MKQLRMRISAPKGNPLTIKRYVAIRLDEKGIADFQGLYDQLKDVYGLEGKPSMSMLLLVALSNVCKSLKQDPKKLQSFAKEIKRASKTIYARKLRKALREKVTAIDAPLPF